MKTEELQKYFDEAKSNEIRFEGPCHDCGLDVCVDVDIKKNGDLVIEGGALFSPALGAGGKDTKFFLKCDDCFRKDATLKNYQPCAVYSRVVGYLRPVSDWNNGKKTEFEDRKLFTGVDGKE